MKLIRLKKVFENNKTEYFILSVIVILAFILRLYKINQPVADWHSWRQVDTASVTKNYLKGGLNLLWPRYHDVSSIQTGYFNPEGYRYVEFPVFNLLHLYLFKTFPGLGFDPAGRIVSILALLSSLIPVYFMGKRYIGKWGGLLSVGIYSLMPYNIYFTRVILPDGLAVAFSVWALFLFERYIDQEKWWMILISGILFSLAILTKPFAVFYTIPMIYLAVNKYKIKNVVYKVPLYFFAAIVLIPFLSWRGWVNRPPRIYGVARLSWAFNGDHIRFKPSFWKWIFGERIGKMFLGMWGLIPFGMGLVGTRKREFFLQYFMAGVILYVIVVATANVKHDYYQLFLIPPISLLTAKGVCEIYNQSKLKLFSSIFVVFCLLMMFLMGLYEILPNYAINHPELMVAGKRMYELSNEGDWVIAPYNGDTTFLYQTGRWGWPVVDNSIENIVEKGADYYISVDTGSADSMNFKQKYSTVEETDRYIILDLNKKI